MALSLALFIRGHKAFPVFVSCRSSNYRVTLQSKLTFQNLEGTMCLAKLGKGMLFSVKQVFVGRNEVPAPLKMPAWEAVCAEDLNNFVLFTSSGVAVRKMSSKPKESDEAFDARWKAYFERQDHSCTINSTRRHILHKNV